MGIKEELVNWTVNYLKNKDVVTHDIKEVKLDSDVDIFIERQDTEQAIVVEPFDADVDDVISRLDKYKEKKTTLVMYNNQGNFDLLVSNWKKLASFAVNFNIIFANPFSQLEKKWIIFPMTHDRISDESSLKSGLQAMFDTVEKTDKERIKEIYD